MREHIFILKNAMLAMPSYVCIIFYLIFWSIAMMGLGCTPNNDRVYAEFRWLIDSHYGDDGWLMEQGATNWYVKFRLSQECLAEIRASDFKERGFIGWKKFYGTTILYGGYVLNGSLDNLLVNEKAGSDDFNRIRMYIDVEKRYLILEYGVTSGI